MNLDVVDLDSRPMRSTANACFALMARCRAAVLLCGLLALQPIVQQCAAAKDLDSDLVATSIRDLNDKSARVRTNAATNLHNIGPSASGAVPRLVSMLSTERDADVRRYVADAIGAAGGQSPEAVPALIHVLRHEREHEVRGAAAKALGRMGLSLELTVPALIAALKDDAEDVRAAAAEALGAKAFATGAPTIVPALVAALSDEAGAVRGNAGAGLVELGPDAVAAVPALRKLLADPASKQGMALWAARILGAIGSGAAPAAPECLAALASETPELRVEAAIALLAFGQHVRPAMDELVKSLRFNDDRSVTQLLRNEVVSRAAWAIGAHAEDASGADAMSLAMAMNDRQRDIRRFASRSFESVVGALVKGHKVDAIASLTQTRILLAQSSDSEQKTMAVVVENAVAELEKNRVDGIRTTAVSAPFAAAAVEQRRFTVLAWTVGAIAIACFCASAWLRRRERDRLARQRMARVFISYRRQDSAASCGRIYDRLVAAFGTANVFRDIDSLAPGELFAQRIRECISRCDVVIALIGRSWLSVVDEMGQRRLDDPADFVVLEIVEAAAQRKPVFPILVEDAQMPRLGDLPPAVAFVAQRNAIEISDRHFSADMKRLVDALSMVPIESGEGRRTAPPAGWEADPWRRFAAAAATRMPVTLFALGVLASAGALWMAFGWPSRM